jgi:hypothetical protein
MRAVRRYDFWIVLVALVACSLWIDFSRIHRFHNSDSLVMVLTSLYQWTPLFWEQDRLGMLFPLLAVPWHHPLANLLAQGAMTTLVGLSSFFLLGYYVAGRDRGITIGALCGIFLVVFARLEQRFAHLIYVHQFATASAVGLAGLILLDRWARGRSAILAAAAVVLVFVAHWINPGVAFAFGPLLVARGLCFRPLGDYFDQLDRARLSGGAEPPWPWTSNAADAAAAVPAGRLRAARLSKDEVVGIAAVACSLAGSVILSRTLAEPLPYAFLPPDEWWACAVGVWNSLNGLYQHRWYGAVNVTALVGLATLYWPAGRKAARLSLRMAAGLLLAAAVQYAFMTSLDHVHRTHYPRYVAMAVLFWQAALVGFAVIQVAAVMPATKLGTRLPTLLVAAMTLVVAVGHGRPSISVVRAEIDASLGKYTDDILAARCTHVTGDYWHVWPAMFHVNMRLADERSPRLVWGIAQRSLPTEKYWRQIPWTEVRIAEIIGDEPQSRGFRAHYRLPPVAEREQVGRIRVLCPTAPWDEGAQIAGQPVRAKVTARE